MAIQIVVNGGRINVIPGPEGMKVIEATDPQSGLSVAIPLTQDASRQVGHALTAGVLVATQPLPSNGGSQVH